MFLAGSLLIFGAIHTIGLAVGVAELPVAWRLGIAAVGLLALAAMDLVAIRRSSYCPVSLRRQTSRVLMRRHRPEVVAAAWGFDTGLAVTTIRVAAATWGALLLTLVGLSVWWVGVGYGLGYAVPFLILLFVHRVGRSARSRTPSDPGLESMLSRRPTVQGLSALVQATAGGAVLARLLIG